MTPKQVARSLVSYGRRHPKLHMSAFVILQVPGGMGRSHAVDGVVEALVKSKKYLLPLILLNPQFAGVLVVDYLFSGRVHLPKNAVVFDVRDMDCINEQYSQGLSEPAAIDNPLS